MTTGTGLHHHRFGTHYTNAQADNLKFKAIKSIVQSTPKLKKVKIWLTLMTLNRELGDRFDLFDVCKGIIYSHDVECIQYEKCNMRSRCFIISWRNP